MKRKNISCRFTIVLGFILFCLLMMPNIALSQEEQVNQTDPTLDAVLKVLVESFNEYNKTSRLSFWELKEASVDLNTTTEQTDGGGFKFLVFSIGSKKTVQDSSTLSIKLAVKDRRNKNKLLLNNVNVKTRIAQAIQLAESSVSRASIGNLTSEMNYELKFTVGWKTEGSITTPDLIPIEFNAAKDITKTKVHSLKLVFK